MVLELKIMAIFVENIELKNYEVYSILHLAAGYKVCLFCDITSVSTVMICVDFCMFIILQFYRKNG